MQNIVIVGGGAGGLELATRLGNRIGRRSSAKVILVDRSPTHFWKPLLHEVASGKLDPQVHQIEYAAQAAEHHFQFICGEVTHVDRHGRSIEVAAYRHDDGHEVLPKRRIQYDKLVLAFGAVTNFFNIPGAAEHSLTLDTVDQAELFRKRLIATCVQASDRRASGAEPAAAVNIVIVGGGATGVELAAELRHTAWALAKYHVHTLDPMRDVHIRIIERSDRVLPHLDAKLSRQAANHLHALGIDICTEKSVARVAPEAVHDDTGYCHPSDITVWAAGVEGPRVCTTLGLALNRIKQIQVTPSLQTLDDSNIFAIGDCSSYVCPIKGAAVPPRAQVAHQQAIFLARILARPQAGILPHFKYRDYGSLVSLGPFAAVGMLIGGLWGRGLFINGVVARILYRLMYRKHVFALHGFAGMAGQALANWIRGKVTPPVKLH